MSARSPIVLTSPLPAGLRPLMTPTTPVPPRPGRHLIAAELPKPLGHECRRAVLLVSEFGMLMDIAAPGLDFGLQVGRAVDDGHGKLGFES